MEFEDRRIHTLGHGDRELKPFLALLLAHGIETVLDIRARPASARFPHFTMDALRQSLDDMGIRYHWAGRHLGGERETRPDSVHLALTDPGLRGFADHMRSPAFQTAMRQMQNLAAASSSVILCAERDPQFCHRRLIADHLVLAGWTVIHLLDEKRVQEHLLSPEARRESAELIYDRY